MFLGLLAFLLALGCGVASLALALLICFLGVDICLFWLLFVAAVVWLLVGLGVDIVVTIHSSVSDVKVVVSGFLSCLFILFRFVLFFYCLHMLFGFVLELQELGEEETEEEGKELEGKQEEEELEAE